MVAGGQLGEKGAGKLASEQEGGQELGGWMEGRNPPGMTQHAASLRGDSCAMCALLVYCWVYCCSMGARSL
jgi:hypothetical protein